MLSARVCNDEMKCVTRRTLPDQAGPANQVSLLVPPGSGSLRGPARAAKLARARRGTCTPHAKCKTCERMSDDESSAGFVVESDSGSADAHDAELVQAENTYYSAESALTDATSDDALDAVEVQFARVLAAVQVLGPSSRWPFLALSRIVQIRLRRRDFDSARQQITQLLSPSFAATRNETERELGAVLEAAEQAGAPES